LLKLNLYFMDNQTKTPNFNKVLDEILSQLKPHQKNLSAASECF